MQFPSVALAELYLVIAYYLTHTAAIDACLSQRQTEAATLQSAVEARFNRSGFARAFSLVTRHALNTSHL